MAGIYVILFRIIPILGRNSSLFPAKICLWSCLAVDFISLVLQATGGGLAGQSFSADVDTKPGTYTMVAGILFQLSATLVYSILMSTVFVRGFQGIRSSTPMGQLASAMATAVACMIARGVYRSIELLQGWNGHLNTTEAYVIGLDGALMVLAVLVLNVCNPSKLLAQGEAEKDVKHQLKDASYKEDIERIGSNVSDVV